jgi:hypothetical protein
MNNDVGTLDVLAGLRYTSTRISLAYQFTAPSTPLMPPILAGLPGRSARRALELR